MEVNETGFDVLLTGGTIVDGSGGTPYFGDVGIRGDRIVAIGALGASQARRVLDCAGLCVSPGFIDVHSHSDTYIFLQPAAPSKIRQGVTTEIVGQCGASASPLIGGAVLPSDWASYRYSQSWQSMREYREALIARDPLMHIVPMTGHRNLRMAVMGLAARPATAEETDKMAHLLEEELANGSIGFTTGLLYQPACYAQPEEIHALARVCARHGGCYATHLRNEGSGLIEAVDEALETARQTGVKLQISHFKTSGPENWHLLETAIERIEAARAEGLRVHADRYPYLASGTDLDIILPEWAARGSKDTVLARLADPVTRLRIVAEMTDARGGDYWSRVQVGGTWCKANALLRGRDIAEIAATWRCAEAEAVIRIVEADGLRTGGFFFGMSEANLKRIYSLPWVMVGSDASLRSPDGVLSDDHPHPRAYGAFPRFLAMCRDELNMPLPEAIRRITALPADVFMLADRGRIQMGHFADITVFDAAKLRDTATYAAPHSYPIGIRHVISSGRVGV